MSVRTKTDRIDFRISEADKRRLEKAAELNHLSLASYIVSVVMKQADADLEQNELVTLNKQDAMLVMSLLESSPEPNENLIKLFQ